MGKTTTASKFPGALILGFEKGWNALPGVYAQPINNWGEFKKLFTELKTPEVQEKFQTLVIDTADVAYSYCERYICSREGVDSIGDIPFGKGYTLVSSEFDECIRRILQLNYGLILISHSKTKTEKNAKGEDISSQIIPTLDNRGRLICERTCDIVGYSCAVETEDGLQTRLFMRGTPQYAAGSRFKYIPDSILFNYDELVRAINYAIDKEAEENGGVYVTDHATRVITEEVSYNFDALIDEFRDLTGELMSANQSNAGKITAIVDKYLGKGKKVGDCSLEQAEQIDLIVHELKNLING